MYVVIKKIKGRRYRYLQRSYRVGRKVKTESIFLGAVEGFIRAQRLSPEDRAVASAERASEKMTAYQRATFGETAEERATRVRQEQLDTLYAAYGMRLGPADPVPVDAPVSSSEAAGGAEPGLGQASEKSP